MASVCHIKGRTSRAFWYEWKHIRITASSNSIRCGYLYPLADKWNLLILYISIKTYYNDVIMSAMESQIASLTIVYSAVYWDADQRKYQSSASLAFSRGIHPSPVNSPHKGPVTRQMFPFDDVVMNLNIPSHRLLVSLILTYGKTQRLGCNRLNKKTHMISVWWHHQMEIFSALLAFCEGKSLTKVRQWCWAFDVFFDFRLNKRLNKQWICGWFETPWCPCDVTAMEI